MPNSYACGVRATAMQVTNLVPTSTGSALRQCRRALNFRISHTHRSIPDQIRIVPYRTDHAEAFYALNRAWLDANDLYEPADEHHLANPVASILEPGGCIFVALHGDAVVGTAAVAPHGHAEVEIAKLTVAESARGNGLGRRLAQACVDQARMMGAERIVLVSNSRLQAALKLYESMGFTRTAVPADVPYTNADVAMELHL